MDSFTQNLVKDQMKLISSMSKGETTVEKLVVLSEAMAKLANSINERR